MANEKLEQFKEEIEKLKRALEEKEERIKKLENLIRNHEHKGQETKRLIDLIKKSQYVDAKDYRVKGQAGLTATLTVDKGGGTCSITVTNGIITASTC